MEFWVSNAYHLCCGVYGVMVFVSVSGDCGTGACNGILLQKFCMTSLLFSMSFHK